MVRICAENRVTFGKPEDCWQGLHDEFALRLGPARRHAGKRVVFVADTMRQALGAVAYAAPARLDMGVIERGRLSAGVQTRFLEHGIHLIDAATGAPMGEVPANTESEPGRITVLTSGTTGLLKLIPHTVDTLNTFDRVNELEPNSWFVPYQIGSYAWYQMVALGLFVPGQHLVPADFQDLMGSFEAALRDRCVTAISSTPTFWRTAFMSISGAQLAEAPLQSISMGGEIVDQSILDRLAQLYPRAKVRHIYASSETGAAIVVSDGRAGFDAGLLNRERGDIALKVADGRLFVRSRYGNRDEAGDWIDTGDLVEERDGRVFFCGRAGNSMINVGGHKAFPPDIEACLMTHPQVAWAKVTARRAPLVGSLAMATVVLHVPMDPLAAELMLTAHCEGKLAEYAIPRMWEFMDQVPLKASLKS